LYVSPDWPNDRVLVGGSVQYQTYQQYHASHNLPAENPPPVREAANSAHGLGIRAPFRASQRGGRMRGASKLQKTSGGQAG